MTWQLAFVIAVGGLGSAACCAFFLMGSYATLCAQRLSHQPDSLSGKQGWPKLSIIVPACDEAETIEAAVRTLLAVDYPDLELVFVDDRSQDATGAIIDRLAAEDSRIEAVHIEELPQGWLGKLNALRRGTQQAQGDFLLFADADVHFSPASLRRAVAWMERDGLGHLAVLPSFRGRSMVYNATISCFAALFLTAVKAWRIGKEGSSSYCGVGAFSMVRRSDFERTPGWEWLKMEVGDDVGLGMMMVQEGGAKSVLGIGTDSLHIDWYPGVAALMRGLEKNAFGAMCGYSAARTVVVVLLMGLLFAGPVVAALSPVPALWAAAGATAVSLIILATTLRGVGQPFLATLLCPLGFPILGLTMARSAVATLRQSGIVWRGKFYPLDELREGRRIDL